MSLAKEAAIEVYDLDKEAGKGRKLLGAAAAIPLDLMAAASSGAADVPYSDPTTVQTAHPSDPPGTALWSSASSGWRGKSFPAGWSNPSTTAAQHKDDPKGTSYFRALLSGMKSKTFPGGAAVTSYPGSDVIKR